jgi:hypothetical protein
MARAKWVAVAAVLASAAALVWLLAAGGGDRSSASRTARRPGTVEIIGRLERSGPVVDGPVAISRDDEVAVVWIETAGSRRQLVAVVSTDGASRFGDPVSVGEAAGPPGAPWELVDLELSRATIRPSRSWWFVRAPARTADLVVTLGDAERGTPSMAWRLGARGRAFEPAAPEPHSGFSWASQRWPVEPGQKGQTTVARARPPRALEYIGSQALRAPRTASGAAPVVALDGHGALYAIWSEREGAVLRRYGVDWVEPRPDTVEFDVPIPLEAHWPASAAVATTTFAGGAVVASAEAAGVVAIRRVWLDLLCKPPSFAAEPFPTPSPQTARP